MSEKQETGLLKTVNTVRRAKNSFKARLDKIIHPRFFAPKKTDTRIQRAAKRVGQFVWGSAILVGGASVVLSQPALTVGAIGCAWGYFEYQDIKNKNERCALMAMAEFTASNKSQTNRKALTKEDIRGQVKPEEVKSNIARKKDMSISSANPYALTGEAVVDILRGLNNPEPQKKTAIKPTNTPIAINPRHTGRDM